MSHHHDIFRVVLGGVKHRVFTRWSNINTEGREQRGIAQMCTNYRQNECKNTCCKQTMIFVLLPSTFQFKYQLIVYIHTQGYNIPCKLTKKTSAFFSVSTSKLHLFFFQLHSIINQQTRFRLINDRR